MHMGECCEWWNEEVEAAGEELVRVPDGAEIAVPDALVQANSLPSRGWGKDKVQTNQIDASSTAGAYTCEELSELEESEVGRG